ncbi:MAG: FliG C-terminal domain-containing protein [Thiobacillus sp.]
MSQAGLERCATLLLALGEEASAAVFRYLSPLEVSQLGAAMRAMRVLPRERVQEVLESCQQEAAQQTGFATDSERFLDDALSRAWGPARAQAVIRSLGGRTAESLQQLAWKEPAEVAALLESEPASLIAVVLSQLPRDSASAVLELLPDLVRGETVLCMAQAEMPAPDVMRDIEAWVAERLDDVSEPDHETHEAAAGRVLAGMSRGSADAVLNAVDKQDAPLAARLRAHTLSFEDLTRVAPMDRKIFLRQVPAHTLLHALKGADRSVVDCLTDVMSDVAAQRMRDDLDTLGVLSVSAIQTAQEEAALLLQRLAAEGAISLPEEATL